MNRFVVDAMLGKVALWLRLTGYDTIYSNELDDDELLRIGKNESRVLLTSDAKLNERAISEGIDTLLLRGSVDERIAEAFVKFEITPDIDPSKSRCTKCNGELTKIEENDKERIKDLVFDKTYNFYDVFFLCEDCQSVFFEGSHWKNMREYITKIRSLMERVDSTSNQTP